MSFSKEWNTSDGTILHLLANTLFWSQQTIMLPSICVHMNFPFLNPVLTDASLHVSLQRSLSLWWTCVDVQRGWLWDENVYRRLRHCLCPSLWRITSSTSESAGPHVETHTRTQRGSLRCYYSATIRPQWENVYIVAHWWNLKLGFFHLFVFQFLFPSLWVV